jgi:hypothetical protein
MLEAIRNYLNASKKLNDCLGTNLNTNQIMLDIENVLRITEDLSLPKVIFRRASNDYPYSVETSINGIRIYALATEEDNLKYGFMEVA